MNLAVDGETVRYPVRRANGRVRFTFHLHETVLDKLRDTIAFIQGKPSAVHNEAESMSSFAERELILAIDRIEQQLGKSIPRRRNEVHFGRPKASE